MCLQCLFKELLFISDYLLSDIHRGSRLNSRRGFFKSRDHFTCKSKKCWEESNNHYTLFYWCGGKVDVLMRHTLRQRVCLMQHPSYTPNISWNTESMASRYHGNKCPHRLLPVCGGKTRWASSVRTKWKMKRKMEVNYIRSYPGLGAPVTKYNGQYWQTAKSHSMQWRVVLSQRLFVSAIYMQFLLEKK